MKYRVGWLAGSLLLVVVMALPLIGILAGLFVPINDTWRHIQHYLLWDYVRETLVLTAGSVGCAVVLASALAWILSAYTFPGSRFLSVALVLPLAIPPYIAGFTWVSMTGYTGVVQVILREHLHITLPPGFLDMQNLGGAVFIFAAYLYPYIYLVVRAFLDRQAGQLTEAAQLLGSSKLRTYLRVIVPLSRNAVIAGATLMAFEVLSDYGVASYFGLQVFSTAIFKSWLGFHDMAAALKLAGILLVVVTTISMGEKALRGSRSHAYASSRVTPLQKETPTGWRRMVFPGLCWGVFVVALMIPVAQLVSWAVTHLPGIRLQGLGAAVGTTVTLASAGAALTTVGAVVAAHHQRLWPGFLSRFLVRVTVMGYSIPSTVIALALLSVVLWFDAAFGLVVGMSPVIIVVAYVIRYLAVSMQSVESGFERIGTRFNEASRMLGWGPGLSLLKVDLPLIRTAVTGAFLLAFIDMVKELPMVLILRPFNVETLSTMVFQYANDEQIPKSAPASLIIIAVALVPVLFLVARSSAEKDTATSVGPAVGPARDESSKT